MLVSFDGNRLSQYETELDCLRRDLLSFNNGLESMVSDLVASRRAKLLADQNLVASLGVPVRRREDAAVRVPVARKIRIARDAPIRGERFVPEPELAVSAYEQILDSARSMGIVMERAPGTFSTLTEEGIRDFFLPQLNSLFEGEAMGEVFNAAGKTDILIRSGERNVFIAECKVWRGPKALAEGTDQLLGNLGWRDTKSAIFLFIRQRSVSEIVDAAATTIRAHPCWKRDGRGGGELDRRYVFHWPGDERRELTLALLAFAVPTTRGGRSRRSPRA